MHNYPKRERTKAVDTLMFSYDRLTDRVPRACNHCRYVLIHTYIYLYLHSNQIIILVTISYFYSFLSFTLLSIIFDASFYYSID